MKRSQIKHMAMIDLIGALDLERALTDEEFGIIKSFSRCTDWRVRMAVAENLGIVDSEPRTIKLLERLANDRNETVRIQAVTSLGKRGGENDLALLEKKAASRSYIVRGYACIAAAELCKRFGLDEDALAKRLEGLAESEKNEWTMQNINCALFLLGRKDRLRSLLDGLKRDDYRIRKASASCLDICIENDPGAEGEIRRYMEENFTVDTEEYNGMMSDVMEDELADMLAEEMNKMK